MDNVTPMKPWPSEEERTAKADAAAAHLPPIPPGRCWNDEDIAAMRAAFAKRFNEDQPRTETLFAVAAIGYRIALREMQNGCPDCGAPAQYRPGDGGMRSVYHRNGCVQAPACAQSSTSEQQAKT